MKKILTITIILILIIFAGFVFHIFSKNSSPETASASAVDIKIPQSYQEALVIDSGNNSLSVSPLDTTQSQVVQTGNQYVYHDAYPNTDVVQIKDKYKIKEELQFRQSGHPTEFKYQIANPDKYLIEKDDKGNFIFYDKNIFNQYEGSGDLGRLFTIPAPFVQDAKGQYSTNAVTSVIENGLLTISIDKNWLAKAVYPVILDPTIEITILNVHSHPLQGQNWNVNFTTQGQADLKIIPNDQATIDDDVFVSLWCGNVQKTPQILSGDAIYYANWICNDIGKVIHYTQKVNNHTLRFEFGGQITYAYNAPTPSTKALIKGGKVVIKGGQVMVGYPHASSGPPAPPAWTCGTGTVTDSDSNVYNTVLIGTQCWMAENLRTTKKPNGDVLTRYCGVNGDSDCASPYGGLYTWAVAMNGSASAVGTGEKIQGICPIGWHIPSDYNTDANDDMQKLSNYLGGDSVAGGHMKEVGTTHWTTPNTGADNTSNFTGIPAGYWYSGSFYSRGGNADFWSSVESDSSNAWGRTLYYSSAAINRYDYGKSYGFSVRCLKD